MQPQFPGEKLRKNRTRQRTRWERDRAAHPSLSEPPCSGRGDGEDESLFWWLERLQRAEGHTQWCGTVKSASWKSSSLRKADGSARRRAQTGARVNVLAKCRESRAGGGAAAQGPRGEGCERSSPSQKKTSRFSVELIHLLPEDFRHQTGFCSLFSCWKWKHRRQASGAGTVLPSYSFNVDL